MKKIAFIAALVALSATAAHAGETSGWVGVTSNYISRGTAQNVYGNPSVQASATYTDKGYYATVFASTMNFGETGFGIADKNTTKELDFFVGKKTTVGKTTVDFSVASINYPDNHAKWNFVEYGVRLDRSFGKAQAGVWVGYTDQYFANYGQGIWTEAHGSYPITDKLFVSGAVANQDLPNNFDYRTWNVGAIYSVTPTVSVDVRYSDTDRHDLDPVFDSYGSAVAVTITKGF